MELSKRMLEFANEPVHVDAEASKEEAIAIVDAIWKDVVLLEWQPEVAQLEAENEQLKIRMGHLQVLAHDYIQAYEKLVFGDEALGGEQWATFMIHGAT